MEISVDHPSVGRLFESLDCADDDLDLATAHEAYCEIVEATLRRSYANAAFAFGVAFPGDEGSSHIYPHDDQREGELGVVIDAAWGQWLATFDDGRYAS